MLSKDSTGFYCPVGLNYVDGDLASTARGAPRSGTLSGLSDGGAHCGSVVDASMPTYLLTLGARPVREATPAESVVKAQTSETADFFGFTDRGRLRPGLRADINLIDHSGLQLHAPPCERPARRWARLVQGVDEYLATLVAGETVFENGEHTGALPGNLCAQGADKASGTHVA